MGGNNRAVGSFRDARGELREGWGSFRDNRGFGSLRTPSFRRGSEHASDSERGDGGVKGLGDVIYWCNWVFGDYLVNNVCKVKASLCESSPVAVFLVCMEDIDTALTS